MGFIEKIKLGNVQYSLTRVSTKERIDHDNGSINIWGQISSERCSIRYIECQPDKEINIIVHEVLHGIVNEFNITPITNEHNQHSESLIDQLSYLIVELLDSQGFSNFTTESVQAANTRLSRTPNEFNVSIAGVQHHIVFGDDMYDGYLAVLNIQSNIVGVGLNRRLILEECINTGIKLLEIGELMYENESIRSSTIKKLTFGLCAAFESIGLQLFLPD